MKQGINMCMYINFMYRTEKILWSLVKNQFLSTCIQNTHGDTINVFLPVWVEKDRQFLWNWFSDK